MAVAAARTGISGKNKTLTPRYKTDVLSTRPTRLLRMNSNVLILKKPVSDLKVQLRFHKKLLRMPAE